VSDERMERDIKLLMELLEVRVASITWAVEEPWAEIRRRVRLYPMALAVVDAANKAREWPLYPPTPERDDGYVALFKALDSFDKEDK